MDAVTRVQILDKAVGISHYTNILWKDLNQIILHPAKGQEKGRLGSLTFVWQPVGGDKDWI